MSTRNQHDRFLDLDSLLAPIRFEGSDARDFLQRQLTCDLDRLDAGKLLHGAWLNPAGRVIVSLSLVAEDQAIVALAPTALREGFMSGLARYVLRSQVTITADPRHVIGGDALRHGWTWSPERQIGLSADPGAHDDRALARWHLADLNHRWVHLSPGTSARYLPQMLDLDRHGAISLDKGCYPGQEIVARTHYLGQVKRTMRLLRAPSELQAESTLYDEEGGEVAGEIVDACAEENGSTLMLAVIRSQAAELRGPDGELLERL